MKSVFSSVVRLVRSLWSPRKNSLNRSRLVGLYMSQTNGRDRYSTDFKRSRERRNGRHTHDRERA